MNTRERFNKAGLTYRDIQTRRADLVSEAVAMQSRMDEVKREWMVLSDMVPEPKVMVEMQSEQFPDSVSVSETRRLRVVIWSMNLEARTMLWRWPIDRVWAAGTDEQMDELEHFEIVKRGAPVQGRQESILLPGAAAEDGWWWRLTDFGKEVARWIWLMV